MKLKRMCHQYGNFNIMQLKSLNMITQENKEGTRGNSGFCINPKLTHLLIIQVYWHSELSIVIYKTLEP